MTSASSLIAAPPQPPLLPPLRWGNHVLPSRYLLAPLAGYTNLSLRLALRELGGLGLATTDLVNARALLRRNAKTMVLINTCPADRPVAVQIYGTEPAEMAGAAQWLESYGVTSVDVNMGCPVHKVTRGGGGSAMMCNVDGTIALIQRIVESVRIPITVKMRLGWDDDQHSAPFFARQFEQVGVAAVIIHGRTRAQGFRGTVNLAGIRAVVEAVERMPVIGNGDVRNLHDAATMLKETGCAGIAIGRGALVNPWFFAQLHAWETGGEVPPPPTYEQRLRFMSRHFHLRVEEVGEHFACLTFRKVANWYSRVLRPGRELHRRMMLVEGVAAFEQIVDELRERGEQRGHGEEAYDAWSVPVPAGPQEKW